MVRIRLRRVGARHQPSYRIIAADKESPRDGRFLENLGFYNPRTEPSTVEIKEDRLFHWLKNGAQPSDAVVKVLKPLGTWDRWERFKGGEDIEGLLEEAEASKVSVDPRTRRDDLAESRVSKKKAKAKAEEASIAEKPTLEVEEPAPEVDEPTEEVEEVQEQETEVVEGAADQVEEEPEMEAEQESEPEAEKEAEQEAPEDASIAKEPAIEVEEPADKAPEDEGSEPGEQEADEEAEEPGEAQESDAEKAREDASEDDASENDVKEVSDKE